MSIIEDVEHIANCCGEGTNWRHILLDAVALLRTHPDAQPNEPLTEAEVEEHKGKPLWFERPSLNHCSDGKWEVVDGVDTYDHVIILRGGKIVRSYGLDAVAYRRQPKEA